MAHHSWSIQQQFGNESDFRTWAGSISNALTQCGMRLVDSTAGPGGINWSSATGITSGLSPAFSSYAGSPNPREIVWEVWRFPTAGEGGGIHGTSPLYLRFGYGQRSSYIYPALLLTVGTAYTVGSGGTITGIGGISNIQLDAGPQGGSSGSAWAASDGNGLVLALAMNSLAANRNVVVIDRHRDLAGAPNVAASGPNAGWSTGVLVCALANGGNARIGHLDPIENDGYYNASTVAPCVTRGGFVSTNNYRNALGQTELYPWWSVTKSGHGVSKMIAGYAAGDLAGPGTEQPVLFLPTTTTRTMKLVSTGVALNTLDIESSPNGGISVATWWSD